MKTRSLRNFIRSIVYLLPFVAMFFSLRNATAQNTSLGPIDVYVSRQNPTATIFNGGLPVYADEGRVININISNITGPIVVNPAQYNLTGPPCPTYTASGRVPATAPPPNTANFSGSIGVNQRSFPAPGTSAAASFTGKDNGYWTKCSQNVQVPYPQTCTVNLNLISINLVMGNHNVSVCDGTPVDVAVSQRYPGTGGTITYQSVNNKVTVAGNDQKLTLTYLDSGTDVVVATLTVSGATYRDSIKVHAGKIKFAQNRYNYLCPVNDNIDLKSLLAPGSIQNNLQFKGTKNDQDEADLPATINKSSYAPGDVVVIRVVSTNPVCEAVTTIHFYGLDLTIPNATVCDGAALPFSATVNPAADNATKMALLATVANLKPDFATAVASLGNPRGNTNLTFAAFDANYNSQVDNMIWYANIATECNDQSAYNLWIAGTINGKAIKSAIQKINADVNGGTCCNGSAGPNQTFVGTPAVFTRGAAGGGFEGYVQNWATFTRNVTATTTNIALATSQWRKPIQDEEDYHVGQIQGTNGVLGALQFVRANVINAVDGAGPYPGATRLLAGDACWAAFFAARNAEIARSYAMYAYPNAHRCAMEKQAKAAVGIKYRFKMSCAYPACP